MKNTKIKYDSKNIKLDGHIGTWSVIGSGYADLTFAYMVEHDQLGDDANYLIISEDGEILCDYHTSIYQYGVEARINRIYGSNEDYWNNLEVSNELADQQMADAYPY